MKVIQILSSLEHSGISRCTLELSKGLVLNEHDSIVIAEHGELVSRLQKDGATFINLPVRKNSVANLWYVKKLRKIILEHAPDIIHLRSRMPAWLTHLALKGIPEDKKPILVSTVHDLYNHSTYSLSLLKTNHIISVSDYLQQHLINHFPEFDNHIHTRIYRGIDPKAYPYLYQPSVHWWNNILAEYPNLEKKIWITMVGSVSKSKGHQWLIDVIGALKSDFPKIHGVIVGDYSKPYNQSYYQELQCLIGALGLDEHFTFTGKRDDIREWLSASNVVLAIDNKPRSFGRTILEAVSMGKPVVGWKQGGIEEILSQTYPEGLIEKEDCLGLIAKIKTLLESPSRPEKSNFFLSKDTINETISLYQTLIEKREYKVNNHSKTYRKLPEASHIVNIEKNTE